METGVQDLVQSESKHAKIMPIIFTNSIHYGVTEMILTILTCYRDSMSGDRIMPMNNSIPWRSYNPDK